MANKIQFSGINRAVSDYSNSGACEELIGLRPTPTGLVPVKAFTTKMNGTSYAKVYEHNVGSQINYIGVKQTDKLYIDRISSSGVKISTLLSLAVGWGFSIDSLHIAVTGNILTISIADEATGLYANYCFRWRDDTYSALEANVPDITPTFTIGTPVIREFETNVLTTTELTNPVVVADTLATGYSAIQTQNINLCFGPTIIAVAFKTIDGDTFWTGKWYALDPVEKIKQTLSASSDYYHFTNNTSTYSWATYFPNTLAVNGDAFIALRNDISSTAKVQNAGAQISMTIPAISGWNKDTSILKSVEVYASCPALYHDASFSKVTTPESVVLSMIAVPELPAKDMGLDGQILYLQKSFNLEELSSQQTFTLRFGGNIQVTDKTLEVDPGMITRAGKMLAYNNRYHYYDSNKRVYLGMPYFGQDLASSTVSGAYVFVNYESDSQKRFVYVGTSTVPGGTPPGTWTVVTAPTLNITKVTVLYQHPAQTAVMVIREYGLHESSTYNYSIDDSGAFLRGAGISKSGDEYLALKALIDAGPVAYIDEEESSAINVSEQYNPFVFRVNHSYLAPATILDLQPQLVAVPDVSYGDYPLNVFTAKGIYALLQGNGEVLYGALRPISNLVMYGNSAVTDDGTFVLAAGSLWLVAGPKAILVSDALSLGPHKELRACSSYASLSRNATNTYNIQPYESDPSFEDFSKGATLAYNRFRDELIVSNTAYNYSYVLSLKYRQWFKIAQSLAQNIIGSDIAVVNDTTVAVVGAYTPDLRIYLYGIAEGDQIEFNVWDTRLYADFVHTVTAAEAANFDTLRDNIIAEWNATDIPDIAGKITMSAANTPAAQTSYARFVSFTITERIEGKSEFSVTVYGANEQHSTVYFQPIHPIVDFSDEVDTGSVTIHLQSRPISFEYQYAHIHRVVDMVRTTLGTGQNLTVALYGSDDLHTWKLLSYANRSGIAAGLSISQLRTPTSARSWRYYTITLGGIIPIDTDLGPLLVDNEPVIRRIG